MKSWTEIIRQVVARAADRCEYCRMHQSLQGATFHVEHVVPRARGGGDDLANLAYVCPSCNLHKSDRVEAVDPDSAASAPFSTRDSISGRNTFTGRVIRSSR